MNRDGYKHPGWPEPISAAYSGLAGDFVRAVEPHTEADPAALLIQFLVGVGNVIGRGPHFQAEADRHAPNLFAALIGVTSKGRKGTSWGHVRRVIASADSGWAQTRVQTGLSSGEGLIHAVRDAIGDDAGVEDKRLFVLESEFASTLRVMGRDGNTLSPTLRQAWDGGTLQVMTKQSPSRAVGAHVSVVAHITRDELRRELTRTDAGSGFGNRFLWACSRRSKVLPDGGVVPESDLLTLATRMKRVIEHARSLGDYELRRDDEARRLWHTVYPGLSEGKPGLLGAVTSRAEAQVMRLACVYALLSKSSKVREDHLSAALSLWHYCEASARFVFGALLGDRLADRLFHLLQKSHEGVTRSELSNSLGRNHEASDIDGALDLLAQYGLASPTSESTGGRPAERWFATSLTSNSGKD